MKNILTIAVLICSTMMVHASLAATGSHTSSATGTPSVEEMLGVDAAFLDGDPKPSTPKPVACGKCVCPGVCKGKNGLNITFKAGNIKDHSKEADCDKTAASRQKLCSGTYSCTWTSHEHKK